MTGAFNSNEPLVSVITVVYNGAKHLERAIRSVIEQGYKNIEYIIVDGGSTDGSLDIIKEYAKAGSVARFISEPDEGIADAFNKGIALSTGEIIGILNADDAYLPGVLKKVAAIFRNAAPDFILHGDMIREKNHERKRIRPRPFSRFWKYVDSPFNHPAMFVPRKVYETVGLYNKEYRFAMDYDFNLRALLAGVKFRYIREDLAVFYEGGRSSMAPLICHKEVLASQKSNGLFQPICYLIYVLKIAVNRLKSSLPAS